MRSGTVNDTEKRRCSERQALCRTLRWSLCLALITSQPSCSQKRVEETVTVDAGRSSSFAQSAQPVAVSPQLPARDADLEQAGDKIAETIMHLKKRQSAAALSALAQAEAALNRALRSDARDEQGREALRSTLKSAETVERAIQHGALAEATTQLVALNRKVDSIGTRP
jgi:hypothetical protein